MFIVGHAYFYLNFETQIVLNYYLYYAENHVILVWGIYCLLVGVLNAKVKISHSVKPMCS